MDQNIRMKYDIIDLVKDKHEDYKGLQWLDKHLLTLI